MFDEKRGNAALLIKHSGFYFIFNPEAISRKEYPHFLREGAAQPRPLSKNGDILSQKSPKIAPMQKCPDFDDEKSGHFS